MVVAKSVPCDFDIYFRVYADGLMDEDVILEATEGTAVVSIILPDDEVALEPDEIHLLTLSLVVYDPQVDLGHSLSHLTIIDDDSELSFRAAFHCQLCVWSCLNIFNWYFIFLYHYLLYPIGPIYYTHQLTIYFLTDTVTVGFDGKSRTVSEDGGGANVSVSLRNEAAVSVSVDVVVVNGTAIEGQGIYI